VPVLLKAVMNKNARESIGVRSILQHSNPAESVQAGTKKGSG